MLPDDAQGGFLLQQSQVMILGKERHFHSNIALLPSALKFCEDGARDGKFGWGKNHSLKYTFSCYNNV